MSAVIVTDFLCVSTVEFSLRDQKVEIQNNFLQDSWYYLYTGGSGCNKRYHLHTSDVSGYNLASARPINIPTRLFHTPRYLLASKMVGKEKGPVPVENI